MRRVRGILFLDYVKMLRRSGSSRLERVLRPEDLELLRGQVDVSAWYPMSSFERFGLAILDEIGSQLDAVRLWGRAQIPQILAFFPTLRAEGDPRDTIIRLGNLLLSLFDFQAVSVEDVDDETATIQIAYGMCARAEEAACFQTQGLFEALIEAAGGANASGHFEKRGWQSPEGRTLLSLAWTAAPTP